MDGAGFPAIKAMLKPREREGLEVFWFSTNTATKRVAQFMENEKACLYFYDSLHFEGLLLTGVVEVFTDQVHRDRLWREGDTLYYPMGITDPDCCTLRFAVKGGRCTITAGRLLTFFALQKFRPSSSRLWRLFYGTIICIPRIWSFKERLGFGPKSAKPV